MNVLLLGVGPIGVEYTKILLDMGHTVTAYGRSQRGCDRYTEATGVFATPGGVDALPQSMKQDVAIVAVSEAQLGVVVAQLIDRGCKKILVEKPGAANNEEVISLASRAEAASCDVRVAYNRRFHASTIKAKELIQADGGVRTFNFEFTEWSHRIEPIEKEPGVKENWFLQNSSHVVDLAFYLGGWPEEMQAWTDGALAWHPHARYAGAGRSTTGALFSYFADWQGPGRWGVEVITPKRKLILRPLEELQVQEIGSIAVSGVEIDDALDKKYKPGFFRQVEAFLNEPQALLSLQEQASHVACYEKMSP